MAATYGKKLRGEGFTIICEACYKRLPPDPYHSFSDVEIEATVNNAIAYVRHGFTCYSCNATLNSPLNIPCLGIENQPFDDSPIPDEVELNDSFHSTLVDFSAMDDRAIALWLNNQPRHGWNIPLWQSIKLHESLNEVIGYFDLNGRSPDIENQVEILEKFLNSIMGFYEQEFPAVFNHLDQGYYFKDTTLRLAMELSKNEPTEKN